MSPLVFLATLVVLTVRSRVPAQPIGALVLALGGPVVAIVVGEMWRGGDEADERALVRLQVICVLALWASVGIFGLDRVSWAALGGLPVVRFLLPALPTVCALAMLEVWRQEAEAARRDVSMRVGEALPVALRSALLSSLGLVVLGEVLMLCRGAQFCAAALLRAHPAAMAALTALVAAAAFAASPYTVSLAVKTRPLEDGPGRRMIDEAFSIVGAAVPSAVLWDDFGRRTANAMVAGLLPGARRLLVTEDLLGAERSSTARAVLCHEAAHVRLGHQALLLSLTVCYASAAVLSWRVVLWRLGLSAESAVGLLTVGFAAVYLAASRIVERQADAAAAAALGDAGAMADALADVSALSGESPRRWRPTHDTTERRIRRLRAAGHVDRGYIPRAAALNGRIASGLVLAAVATAVAAEAVG